MPKEKAPEKELEEELEQDEEQLEKEISRKGRGQDEDFFPGKGMEFCSRCGKKIESIKEYAGRCMVEGCASLLCDTCWSEETTRYCSKHRSSAKKEEPAETLEDEKAKNFTLNCMEMVEERLKQNPIDWTPHEYIRGARAKVNKKKYGEFTVVIFRKGLVFSRKKIKIMVMPLDYLSGMEMDLNQMMEKLDRKVHNIAIFASSHGQVTDSVRNFFGKFSNRSFSIYLLDFEKGELHCNMEDMITRNYSPWFDPKQKPKQFPDMLAGFAENMSGRSVISTKKFAEEFGITVEESERFLKKCRFLSEIERTDSFLFKK
jgi:hypothetical protein